MQLFPLLERANMKLVLILPNHKDHKLSTTGRNTKLKQIQLIILIIYVQTMILYKFVTFVASSVI